MHKKLRINRYVVSAFLILILSGQLFIYTGCYGGDGQKAESTSGRIINELPASADYPAFIKYRSFQNTDLTWGFTVFVNSRPYLHFKKIQVNGYETGFVSQVDAEKVAELFVLKIREGYYNPKLTKRTLDSLGIQKSIRK